MFSNYKNNNELNFLLIFFSYEKKINSIMLINDDYIS